MPLQNAIKIKLTHNGFDVLTARRVINGMDIFENEEGIDAVWMDHYLLGRENGFDMVQKIKNSVRGKSVPIFVVSNTASDDNIKRYQKIGISKYYTKSDYRLEEIISDIKTSIDKDELS